MDNGLHVANDVHVTIWRDWRYRQARRFLHQLDAEADAFTFQTFDDTPAKRRELARIPFLRVGRLVKYRLRDLDAWLASRVVDGKAP